MLPLPPPAPGVCFCCCAICCAVSGFIPSARCLACANCGLVCTNCLGGRVLISLLTYSMRLPGCGWSLGHCGELLGYFWLMISENMVMAWGAQPWSYITSVHGRASSLS